MKSLKSLLHKKSAEIRLPRKATLDDKDIFYVFKRIIREEFGNIGAGNLEADFFKNKTIFVKSKSPTWASELWLNKGRIIRKLNRELGSGAIEEIKTK